MKCLRWHDWSAAEPELPATTTGNPNFTYMPWYCSCETLCLCHISISCLNLLPTKAAKLLRTLQEPRTPKTRQQQGTGMHSAFHRKKTWQTQLSFAKGIHSPSQCLLKAFTSHLTGHQAFWGEHTSTSNVVKRHWAFLIPTESSAVLKCIFHCFRGNKNPIVPHRSNSATPHLLHAVKAHIKAKLRNKLTPYQQCFDMDRSKSWLSASRIPISISSSTRWWSTGWWGFERLWYSWAQMNCHFSGSFFFSRG